MVEDTIHGGSIALGTKGYTEVFYTDVFYYSDDGTSDEDYPGYSIEKNRFFPLFFINLTAVVSYNLLLLRIGIGSMGQYRCLADFRMCQILIVQYAVSPQEDDDFSDSFGTDFFAALNKEFRAIAISFIVIFVSISLLIYTNSKGYWTCQMCLNRIKRTRQGIFGVRYGDMPRTTRDIDMMDHRGAKAAQIVMSNESVNPMSKMNRNSPKITASNRGRGKGNPNLTQFNSNL